MELFSLGVGNYTEHDIKEGARALTGYTFRDDEFVFNHENHDKGNKTHPGPARGLDGEGFVARSSHAPACAQFIATKLYDFFCLHMGTDEADAIAVRRAIQSSPARCARTTTTGQARRCGNCS
jgi:uncharacterized protein (DUF1800 family)